MAVKAPSTPPQKWWKVIKTRDHGGHIAGARRKVGEVFAAPANAMTFDALEGLVEETTDPDAPAAVDAAAPKAKPAAKINEDKAAS
ncbi:MAG TPA: hypothetical protein VIF61_00385 [Methylocystis sp.]|jgi:hypothetical protein